MEIFNLVFGKFFLGKIKEIFIKLTNLREYAIINNFYK